MNSNSGSASTSSTDSSRSGSGWLEEYDDDAVNNINSTFTLKSINSSQYYLKLGKMVKNLFKMVVNVEKILKMVENGDFFKICHKMVKC